MFEFGDALHAVEQGTVVADQEQAAVEVLEHVVELVPGLEIEVVGGFVEQQYVGPLEQLGGESEGDDLAPAEGVLGATRPVRPEPMLKDRSWNTGVSSGQLKDRFEQTTAALDMDVTS
jgi:hypothetical protein